MGEQASQNSRAAEQLGTRGATRWEDPAVQSVGQSKRHRAGARLTRQQVIDALRDQDPGIVHSWAVEIDGRRFPLPQVWTCVINEPRSRYKTETACAVLERLGFRPFHTRRPHTDHSTRLDDGEGATAARGDPYTLAQRLGALIAAIQFLSDRPQSQVADVLKVAREFEGWLAR
jgi:hypothetical protein